MDSEFDVICFGDINVDYIGRMDRIPNIDEELPIYNLEKFCGGAATNVAVALARLDKKTGYMGSIGDDSNGKELLERLQNEGVDVSRVNKKEGYLSGTVFAIIDNDGERRLLSYLGANLQTKKEDFDKEYISKTKILHMSNPLLSVVPTLLSYARENNLMISFDPGTLISSKGLKEIEYIIKETDILFLNRVEYNDLVKNSEKGLDEFLERGCKMVVYKKGKEGSLLKTANGKEINSPGFNVEVVDTTGAGDAFAGGFLTAYLNELELKDIMEFANAVAAISVTSKGAKEALPTLDKVLDFIKNKN
ncbi:MAG: carbohydrate kinase family protein [Bacillota bacterium]